MNDNLKNKVKVEKDITDCKNVRISPPFLRQQPMKSVGTPYWNCPVEKKK